MTLRATQFYQVRPSGGYYTIPSRVRAYLTPVSVPRAYLTAIFNYQLFYFYFVRFKAMILLENAVFGIYSVQRAYSEVSPP